MGKAGLGDSVLLLGGARGGERQLPWVPGPVSLA